MSQQRNNLSAALVSELNALKSSAYRQQQNITTTSKGLSHLRKLLRQAENKQPGAVANFARCVHDVGGPTSRLSQLTSEFVQSVEA